MRPFIRTAAFVMVLGSAGFSGAQEPSACGDVNCDGKVVATDALQILRVAVALETLTCEVYCPATTTTSSTSSTSTTSSTTTTTQAPPLACGDAHSPQCDGGCPSASQACRDLGGGCECVNVGGTPCGGIQQAPQCLGACAPDLACVTKAISDTVTCVCAENPSDVVLCGDADAPTCDGGCLNAGETCGIFMDICACVPIALPCGQLLGPPQCQGECPPLEACVDDGGSCVCRQLAP